MAAEPARLSLPELSRKKWCIVLFLNGHLDQKADKSYSRTRKGQLSMLNEVHYIWNQPQIGGLNL